VRMELDGSVSLLVCAPCRLLWSEGGSQPDSEASLGLTFGFPAVAALSKVLGTAMGASAVGAGMSIGL
jgi:hypothetical protein